MPELPEVETVASGLRAALIGQRVAAIALYQPSIFSGTDLAELEAAEVVAIHRAGKYLIFELRSRHARHQLMIHLGMTGQLLLVAPGAPRARHTHAVFVFGEKELHFRDPRRFGRIALAPAPATGYAPALGIAPGLEPLEATQEQFAQLFFGRAAPIKNALLNQKLLRGVGNIYADESLFRAGIHPRAQRVSRPRLERLRQSLQAVLGAAIRSGGSSISDYVNSAGEPGWFHLEHKVYGRESQPCPNCGHPIRRAVLAGRSAHFCANCQKR